MSASGMGDISNTMLTIDRQSINGALKPLVIALETQGYSSVLDEQDFIDTLVVDSFASYLHHLLSRSVNQPDYQWLVLSDILEPLQRRYRLLGVQGYVPPNQEQMEYFGEVAREAYQRAHWLVMGGTQYLMSQWEQTLLDLQDVKIYRGDARRYGIAFELVPIDSADAFQPVSHLALPSPQRHSNDSRLL